MTTGLRRLWLCLLSVPALGWAQAIPDRATLSSIVGATGALADFESFTVTPGAATNLGTITFLDSTSLINSQGPNLVPGGVSFSFGSGNLQWDGSAYFGSPSQEILANSNFGTLTIGFTVPVVAFGLDLRAFAGFPATASVSIYAGDNVSILATISGIALSTSGVPVFFGYQAVAGIGQVMVSQTGQSWSPLIDNLRFSPIPEPPVFQLLAGGGATLIFCRLRRCRAP